MTDTRKWFLYIIECRDKKLYTGIALDVPRRISEHNRGTGCRFTKYRWPVKLLYQEVFADKSSARKREIEIKRFKRSEKIDLLRKGPSASCEASGSNFTS